MREQTRIISIIVLFVMILSSISIVDLNDVMGNGKAPVSDYHNGTLNVNATYPNGTPVVGLYVRWQPENSYIYSTMALNSTGQASFDIKWEQLGQGEIRVEDSSYDDIFMEHSAVFPDEIVYKDIVINPIPAYDRVITGIVRNLSSSLPIEGVLVSILGQDSLGNYVSGNNITGVDGRYSLMAPLTESRSLSLSTSNAPGYYTYYRTFFTREGQTTYNFDFELLPLYISDGQSRVRFINTSNGQPINKGDMQVFLNPAEYAHRGEYDTHYPDTDGWYEIDSKKGETELDLNADFIEYPDTDITVVRNIVMNGTPEDMEFELTPPSSITVNVTVKNSTSVLKNARISWSNSFFFPDGLWSFYLSSNVNPDGSLEFELPIGQQIIVQAYQSGYNSGSIVIDTSPVRALNYEIILEEYEPSFPNLPTGTVKIVVVDNLTGLPIKDAEITGVAEADGHYYSNFVDANGTGVFEGELYAGKYSQIEASCSYGKGKVRNIVVVNGSNDPIEIRIDRDTWEVPPVPGDYYLTFKDPSGTPVNGLRIWLNTQAGGSFTSGYFFTDPMGRIYVKANPGGSLYISTSLYPENQLYNPWVFNSDSIVVPMTPGSMGEVTLYPRGETDEIIGFTRNSNTGEVIGGVHISAYSYHPTGSSRMMMGPPHPEGITLFNYDTGSMLNGFFRTWGMDHVVFRASRVGYYPKEDKMDLSTRASNEHDIYLDPIGDIQYWVNGTLVDEEGTGIHGYIEASDNDHPLFMTYTIETGVDGSFSILMYPGNYSFLAYNNTLSSKTDVMVTGQINDLMLVLKPSTFIAGIVTNTTGDAVPGINVVLQVKNGGTFIVLGQATTNATGFYTFTVNMGEYRLIVERTTLYDPYQSDPLITDGWNPIIQNLILDNLTSGNIMGKIIGDGGPFQSGIPGANVTLIQDGGTVSWTKATLVGSFLFEEIPFGTYSIIAVPPEELQPVEDLRSGYLEKKTENFSLSVASFDLDITLEFIENSSPSFVNITYNTPEGEGVYLDSPIMIEFSHTMNISSVSNGIIITPEVANVTFDWDGSLTIVTLNHDPFQPDTNYSIRILSTVISYEGFPLWDEFEWWFMTGNNTDPWDIYSADVTVDEGKNVSIIVTAPPDLDIFIFFLNIDYLKLTEGTSGTYRYEINGTLLDWDTEYDYFFTDSYGGLDRAREFNGTIRTPEEPYTPSVWTITSATVEIRESGTWDVNIQAPEGQTIYIVIDGIGSFLVVEDAPGYYRVLIPYEEFEWEKEYDHHFSETEGGPDMAPSFSGTSTMPKEPSSGSSSDDPPFYLCCIGIVVVLVIILVVVMLLVMRKKGKGDSFEE